MRLLRIGVKRLPGNEYAEGRKVTEQHGNQEYRVLDFAINAEMLMSRKYQANNEPYRNRNVQINTITDLEPHGTYEEIKYHF